MITAALAFVSAGLLLAASNPREEFLSDQTFSLGMNLAAASAQFEDTQTWTTAYRVDTPQTSEIAVRRGEGLAYILSFYQGSLYSIEKRGEVAKADIDPLYQHYIDLYGATPEATQSRDQSLYFARWTQRDHEIELTAYLRDTGKYSVILEDQNSRLAGEAAVAQEQEIGGAPSEIDPLTGKARLATHGEPDDSGQDAQQDGAGQDQPAEDGKNSQDAKDKKDEKAKPEEKRKDGDSSGSTDTDKGTWDD